MLPLLKPTKSSSKLSNSFSTFRSKKKPNSSPSTSRLASPRGFSWSNKSLLTENLDMYNKPSTVRYIERVRAKNCSFSWTRPPKVPKFSIRKMNQSASKTRPTRTIIRDYLEKSSPISHVARKMKKPWSNKLESVIDYRSKQI